MDCNDYMVKEFFKNNLPYRYLSYTYKKPTHYSTNPSSMDFSFQGITSKQISLVKSLIKMAGFEIVKDEIVKRNVVKMVKDDLAEVNNNYKISIYAKEINEINNIKKLIVQ